MEKERMGDPRAQRAGTEGPATTVDASPAPAAEVSPAPPPGSGRLAALAGALRVHQWSKNLLLFVPAVLDHRLLDGPVMLKAFLAFAAFCCAASSAYVLNDLLDREADRWHPTRRNRPFAAGHLSRSTGLLLCAILLGLALAIALAALPPRFTGVLLLYLGLTTAYSLWLKRVPVLDVLLLAGFYTLRVLAGLAATEVRFSTWLLAFSMFFFLSLAFVKRYAELARLRENAGTAVPRRGYVASDREWMSSLGSASGYLSVLVLALYINSSEVVALYRRPLALWLLCPLLLYWISRIWLLAHRGKMHDDPIVAALRDPASYAIGLGIAAILLAAS
jgi:4-hydroxybenzoate polyprenyltransferase